MLTTASCWLELTIPSFTSIWLLAPHKHVGCTCCIFGNDWVFQSYVPCKQKSQVATPDCHLRWRGNHQAFAFNLLAQSGLVIQYHGHKQLRGEYQNGGQWHRFASTENWIPTLVHMEVPKLQLPHFLTALFSHSEPRLPPWIVQKMACEDAGKSEVGASIVLTDSCIGNKMVMRRHVRNS